MYKIKSHYLDNAAGQWDMAHDIINAVRLAKGVPLSTAVNPHMGSGRKQESKLITSR